MSRIMAVADFLHSGKRWYQHWKGVPYIDRRFAQMLDWISYYGSEITSNHPLNITEFGPNGGKFTYTVLRQLNLVGFPKVVNYSIYGEDVELTLTQRDALKVLDKDCRFGKTARVLTHAKTPADQRPPNLITELTFIKKDLTQLKLADSPQNLILCVDSFSSYPTELQARLMNYFRHNLAYCGTLIFSVPTRTQFYHSEKLKANFQFLGYFQVEDMTYSGWSNNEIR